MLRQTAMLKSIKGWRNLAALHANLAIAKSTLIPLAKMGRFLGALYSSCVIGIEAAPRRTIGRASRQRLPQMPSASCVNCLLSCLLPDLIQFSSLTVKSDIGLLISFFHLRMESISTTVRCVSSRSAVRR